MSRKSDWIRFSWLLVWAPGFAAGLMPHSGEASWSVDGGVGDYRLSIDILAMGGGKAFWDSRFDTKVALDKPLTFRLKSGNGTLVCTVRLVSAGPRRFRLHYETEAVVEGERETRYLKGSGDTVVLLGREVHVSPLGKMDARNRLKGMVDGGGHHRRARLVLIGFRVDPP